MDARLSEEVKYELTELLRKLEARTELEACAVVSKEGMRIACAVGAELDADVYSAASAALVNLGETTLKQLHHGTLKEIIVRGDDGYTILTSAGPSHMIVGSCKNMSRMGYYLALLHRFSAKIADILGYEVETPTPVPRPTPLPAATSGPTAASLLEVGTRSPTVRETIPQIKSTPTPKPMHVTTPPLSQIRPEPVKDAISEALEALNPLEEPETIELIEEPESIPVHELKPLHIEEPEPIPIEEPEPIFQEPEPISSKGSADKGVLFQTFQSLGSDKESKPPVQPTSKVGPLVDALKPQPAPKVVPFATQSIQTKPIDQSISKKSANKSSTVPFVATTPPTKGEVADDDLFKISDKEAVLEALKVLGWEEPEDKK